ncbi:MAG: hypothetical protein MPEBLZ_00989 [Candidatus Methanoperedens nitroreducens]|uniref:Uncharacterized protein n=1 Tax=Candidatus Methanoperedens nitratireducens TaxID=1392998 RepID=A0A0P8ACG2_9EURY|nr:hypothetical protein [Candidatus Methanoperedens sp. BLZ2]KPQ44445.1 MAG: hypothetical protein MPEBLZ_00989 [Candidatus Methanoperedens sp. BLZ1]MBZ0177031.1 hypothetical protein [Candidatus Methanoperedens nitroreducens]MCX9079338.1 hypothetical protein [Candidatus Methanoperedens sp.]
MEKQKATLFVDKIIYQKYKSLCKRYGWIVSKQFENFMVRELEKEGEKIRQ